MVGVDDVDVFIVFKNGVIAVMFGILAMSCWDCFDLILFGSVPFSLNGQNSFWIFETRTALPELNFTAPDVACFTPICPNRISQKRARSE